MDTFSNEMTAILAFASLLNRGQLLKGKNAPTGADNSYLEGLCSPGKQTGSDDSCFPWKQMTEKTFSGATSLHYSLCFLIHEICNLVALRMAKTMEFWPF